MPKLDDTAIKVSSLSKTFKLPHEKQNSIKGLFVNIFKGKRTYEKQRVLKDISFEIKKGEFFGIVGRNGSGKSTLLKLLAGIYTPDKGDIQINGKLTPFIELGVGFNPELTGRENVFLNGALLGFNRKEMLAMYDEIVEFAELEKFMDQKLKNYSSGMQVRLAFSIAIRANAGILLLDEVLAVGDEAFQKKCYEYFAKLKKENKTVILVTHDMSSVQRFCTRAMLVNNGKIEYIGTTAGATRLYENLNKTSIKRKDTIEQGKKTLHSNSNENASMSIELHDSRGKATQTVFPEDKLRFHIEVKPKKVIKDAFVGFTIHKPDGECIYWMTTENESDVGLELSLRNKLIIDLELQNIFGENTYTVNLSIKSGDRSVEYMIINDALTFKVVGQGRNSWMLRPNSELKIENSPIK